MYQYRPRCNTGAGAGAAAAAAAGAATTIGFTTIILPTHYSLLTTAALYTLVLCFPRSGHGREWSPDDPH
jgi:hypothetical protein